ncbi:hypothetical protein [Mesorhizobium sp.]|uniref:hypothetical protein n=1 Tax=Mesorhizobium sp. TaxID=1871066 RepID=UPI0025CBB77E|nr:hypothetical protein [Mesorhizobium sp.]
MAEDEEKKPYLRLAAENDRKSMDKARAKHEIDRPQFRSRPIRPGRQQLVAMTKVLEGAGLVFIPENGGGAGVRLQKS